MFEAAHDAHVLAIGVDSDQYDDLPGTIATSMVKRADVAVFDAIHAVVQGRFEPGTHSFGLAQEGVDYVHDGPHGALVPAAVKAKVALLRDRVVSGEVVVPSL